MTKYYKQLDENGKIIALLTYDFVPNITNPLIIEITAKEYEAISVEWREKAFFADQLYIGEITLDDVPEEWREEIQRRVDERISREGEYEPSEIELKAQAYDIITGVSE